MPPNGVSQPNRDERPGALPYVHQHALAPSEAHSARRTEPAGRRGEAPPSMGGNRPAWRRSAETT